MLGRGDSTVDLFDGESISLRSSDNITSQTSPVVAVVRTSPETVLDDVKAAMKLAGYTVALPKDFATLLKINISWQHYYPACSTTPWQLDGVIRTLVEDGYKDIIPTHNGTVVVDAKEGQIKNGHKFVEELHNLNAIHLEEQKWIPFESKEKFLVLDKIYKQGIHIPEVLMGKNIVHLPTMKTHVFTTITGAMKMHLVGY